MPSLRGAIESRVRPIDLPISLRSVARRIGLTDTPLRGEQILDYLSDPLVRNSGQLHAVTVSASAAVGLHLVKT